MIPERAVPEKVVAERAVPERAEVYSLAGCACGLSFDHAGWERLRLVGGMDADDPDKPTLILELRNCSCGSTISLARVSSAPTRASREAAVRLLTFEAERLKTRKTG